MSDNVLPIFVPSFMEIISMDWFSDTISKLNITKWLNSVSVSGVTVVKLCTLFDQSLYINQVSRKYVYLKGFQSN